MSNNRRNDYQEIRTAFNTFIKAWETGKFELLDDIVSADVSAEFSIFGECHSRENVKGKLKERPSYTYTRFETGNFVALIEGCHAYQSGCVIGMFADDSGDNYRYYQWGGNFCNVFTYLDGRWMITDIKFDLQDDIGDRTLVEQWTPINDRLGWYTGVPLPVISGEIDVPWYKCSNRENIGTEEEQIEELYYRYALGIDCNTFRLLEDVFSESLVMNMYPFGVMNKRTFIATLKVHRQAYTRRWHHVGYFKSIQIHDNTADCILYRNEPYRNWPLVMSKSLENKQIVAAHYDMKAIKEEDGKWRICKFDYFHGPFITGSFDV